MNASTFRKETVRRIRYLGITERLRYQLRKSPTLVLEAIGLTINVDPNDVMLDCGANVGDISSKFARTGATVYAFEPNPLCFDVITKRFALMPKVHCLHNGVMNRDCVLNLSTPEPHAGFDSLETTVAASFNVEALQSPDYAVKVDQIHCIDIDAFVRQLGKRVRLMKVDIEGAEIEVLNRLMDTGAIDLIDHVIVETHEDQMPHLAAATQALRARIATLGLTEKICLDWY